MSISGTHKSEIDHLKELVRQSGFPLEIEIVSFLDSARVSMDWKFMEVFSGAYYLDKDENKGRELDVKVSIPVEYEEEQKRKQFVPGIFLRLLIQCKSVPGNVWVFFRTPQEFFPRPQCASVLDSLEWSLRSHWDFSLLPGLHYEKVPKITLYDEYILDKNKSNKRDDNLFEAVISLVKATSYELESTVQALMNDVDAWGDDAYNVLDFVILFYPTVVFDGKMFLAEKTEEYGELNLTPIDHVCLFSSYLSASYDMKLYMDIVQREAFESFFSNIVEDTKVLWGATKSKIGTKFRKEVIKALRWYLTKKRVRYKPTQ